MDECYRVQVRLERLTHLERYGALVGLLERLRHLILPIPEDLADHEAWRRPVLGRRFLAAPVRWHAGPSVIAIPATAAQQVFRLLQDHVSGVKSP